MSNNEPVYLVNSALLLFLEDFGGTLGAAGSSYSIWKASSVLGGP